MKKKQCPSCDGEGFSYRECDDCDGEGEIEVNET